MQIRKATREDLDAIMEIYEDARRFMVQTGNPRQWASKNWPPKWLVEQDMARGKCHVCQVGEEIVAVFYYDFGDDIDPTYRTIEDGAWLSDSPYGVVHRIAAQKGRGAGKFCIRWAYEQCGHLRIDTHGDNRVMQKVLAELGFSYCGVIHIPDDNDPRLAYEKI